MTTKKYLTCKSQRLVTRSPVEGLAPGVLDVAALRGDAVVTKVKESSNLLVDEGLTDQDENNHVRVTHAQQTCG